VTRAHNALAFAALEVLLDRKGFDAWWDEVTPATRQEIRREIAKAIGELLAEIRPPAESPLKLIIRDNGNGLASVLIGNLDTTELVEFVTMEDQGEGTWSRAFLDLAVRLATALGHEVGRETAADVGQVLP